MLRWDLALEMLTTLGTDVGEKFLHLTVGHSFPTSTPIVGGHPLALLYGIRVQFGAVIWEYTSTWALLWGKICGKGPQNRPETVPRLPDYKIDTFLKVLN